jgi:hypothetical protein
LLISIVTPIPTKKSRAEQSQAQWGFLIRGNKRDDDVAFVHARFAARHDESIAAQYCDEIGL